MNHLGNRRLGRVRRALPLGAGLVALTLVAACGSSGGSSKGASGGDTTLRIAYQVIPNGAPIVKHEKWLEKNLKGVKVEWTQFDAAQDVVRAMASGAVDVGLVGSTGVSTAVAKGLGFEVPWIYDIEGDNEALVVKKDKGINSVADLAGKTIATPFGSTTQYSLIAALKDAGVYGKVKVLDMKPPEALAAWTRGDIVGSYIWEPTLAKMKDNGGKVIISSKQLSKKGVVTADLAIVAKSFAKKNPDVVSGWLKQEDRAVKMIKSDPKGAAKIVADEFQITEADASSQMKELVFLTGKEQLGSEYLGPDGKPGALASTLDKTCDFLKSQTLIPSCPAASTFKDAVNGTYLSKVSNN
ncbi:glycine betaine ABC transporter substrate-binding protein [Leekyejoonella antrihumi]|nr:glycine betaine ABC transporter substrate-binding protein [Leekyejoonella antrihumi]